MPDVTPKGLPFPLSTDPLTDGAAAIQALAEAIDSLLGGGGAELGVAQRTAYFNLTYAVYVDSGLAVTFDAVAGQDYMAEVYWPGAATLGGNEYRGQITVDGVAKGVVFSVNAATGIGPINARQRLQALPAGAHTVRFQATNFGGGAGVLYCGDGALAGNYVPAFLRVIAAGPTPAASRPGPGDETIATPKELDE